MKKGKLEKKKFSLQKNDLIKNIYYLRIFLILIILQYIEKELFRGFPKQTVSFRHFLL